MGGLCRILGQAAELIRLNAIQVRASRAKVAKRDVVEYALP